MARVVSNTRTKGTGLPKKGVTKSKTNAKLRLKSIKDARNTLVTKQKKQFKDARDKLSSLAKTGDARDKLTKIRNLKSGKLNVKKTAGGGVEITTTTTGKLVLTTVKKQQSNVTAGTSNTKRGIRGRNGSAAPLGTTKKTILARGKVDNRPSRAATSANRNNNLKSIRESRDNRRSIKVNRTDVTGGIVKVNRSLNKGGSRRREGMISNGVVRRGGRGVGARTPQSDRMNGRRSSNSVPARRKRREEERRGDDIHPITRTIRGRMSSSALLDDKLLRTRVDPRLLQRTVDHSRSFASSSARRSSHSPPPQRFRDNYNNSTSSSRSSLHQPSYSRYHDVRVSPSSHFSNYGRTRSPPLEPSGFMPSDHFGSGSGSSYHHGGGGSYQDSHSILGGGGYNSSSVGASSSAAPLLSSYERKKSRYGSSGEPLHSSAAMASVSSLSVDEDVGCKVIVSNLQATVSREDIVELFGDIGPLKRVRVLSRGAIEVVFIERSDAKKSVQVYHNRQLDGSAMNCVLVTREEMMDPEIGTIHNALFKSPPSSSSANRMNRSRNY